MKKFLVILMVIAMVSVLFVGCTTPPTPTPTPEPEPEPVPVVTAAEAVAAVKDAAIILDQAVLIVAGDIATFLEALADANFTGYLAANDAAYVTAAVAGSFSAVTTVALVNTAIAAVETTAAAALLTTATAAVVAYEGLGVGTDALIVIANASKAGTKEGATAAVAALTAGSAKTLLEARIVAQDLVILTASTISTVFVGPAAGSVFVVSNAINTLVEGPLAGTLFAGALVRNAVPIALTTGVTYAWSVISASNSGTAVHTAVIGDLAFSSTTAAVPVITKGNVTDIGDTYTIKVIATKSGVSVSDTALVTVY